MAESKAIITFKFETQEAVKRSVELTAELEKIKSEQAKVTSEVGKGSKEWVENESKIKVVKDALRESNKEIENSQKFINAQTGSLTQLKLSLSDATKRFNDLSRADRENAEIGGVLQKQIAGITKELKAQEKSLGDNRRNVGNYSESIEDAFKGMGLFSKEIAILKGAQEKLTAAQNLAKTAILGNVSAFGALKLAIIGTGIGALVIVIGGLIAYFTRTQEGLDFISVKMKGLTTVVGVITDKFSAVGEAIFKAFDNPKQAIKDLVDLIATNLLNRAKALLLIFEAITNRDFTKMQDGIAQLATGITDATAKVNQFTKEVGEARKEGERIAKETLRIRDAELKLNEERSASVKLIKQLNMIGEDTTKGIKVQSEAIKKAMGIEIDLNNKLHKLQGDKIRNIQAEQKLTNNLTKDNDELSAAKIKQDEIDTASFELRTTLQNKLNTLRKTAESAGKATAEAFQKERDDRNKLDKQLADELESDKEMIRKTDEEAAKKIAEQLIKDNEQAIKLKYDELAADERITERNIQLAEQRAAAAMEYGSQIADIFQASLTEQGFSVEAFQNNLVALLIDTLEKVALAAIFEGTARSASSAQSIATGGAAGLIQAAILTAVIKTAAGVAKSALTKQAPSKFEQGGAIRIGGRMHSEGGTKFEGSDGTRFEAQRGENLYILNNKASDYINGLSNINQAFGGRKFADGGFVERSVSRSIAPQSQQIQVSPVVRVTDIRRVMANETNVRVSSELR